MKKPSISVLLATLVTLDHAVTQLLLVASVEEFPHQG